MFDDNTSGVVSISPGISSTSHRLWNRYTARSRRSQDCSQLGILRSSSTTPLITSTCSLLARCLASTHLYGRSTYISFVLTISIPGNPSSFPAHIHRFPSSNIPRNPVSRTTISQNSNIPGLRYPKTPIPGTPKMATRTATASTTSPRPLAPPSTTSPRRLIPSSATTIPSKTSTTHQPPASLSTLWWNLSLPAHAQTPTCPSYLLYATHHPKELKNLSTPDALFTRQTWPQVRSLIAANRLDQFTRVPSELREYRKWTEGVVREYGSMMRFILEERLGWKGEIGTGEGRFGRKGMVATSNSLVLLVN